MFVQEIYLIKMFVERKEKSDGKGIKTEENNFPFGNVFTLSMSLKVFNGKKSERSDLEKFHC